MKPKRKPTKRGSCSKPICANCLCKVEARWEDGICVYWRCPCGKNPIGCDDEDS